MIPPELKEALKNFLIMNRYIIFIIIELIILAYISVAFMGKNNVVEVEIEKVIDKETGLNIDLTP